ATISPSGPRQRAPSSDRSRRSGASRRHKPRQGAAVSLRAPDSMTAPRQTGSDLVLERLNRLHPKIIDLGLDRVADLLQRVGNPQDRLPPVVHVAGTNGKGSTIAYLRAMCEAAGYRVHVY